MGSVTRSHMTLFSSAQLYANEGALTPGIDPHDTVQSMNRQRIADIINDLKTGTYQWTPVRRVNISKKKGKTRPIGILVWRDKLLQEVIRMILEAYYNPQFSELSHGYRPHRGCHTAFQEISKWHGTKWFVEADLEKCFDKIDHDQLLIIMGRKIKDPRFLKLIKDLLKAGYLENWQYQFTYSGTPQGGLCKALHNPPYAKKAIMQSNGPKQGILAVFGRFTLHNLRTYFKLDSQARSS